MLFGAAVLHNYNRRTYYSGVLERACGNDDDDDDAFCSPNHFFFSLKKKLLIISLY